MRSAGGEQTRGLLAASEHARGQLTIGEHTRDARLQRAVGCSLMVSTPWVLAVGEQSHGLLAVIGLAWCGPVGGVLLWLESVPSVSPYG